MTNAIQSTTTTTAAWATTGLAVATVSLLYVRLMKQQQRRQRAESETDAMSNGEQSHGRAVDDGALSSGIDQSVVTVTLPPWVHESDYFSRSYPTREDRMALAIHLSARNVAEKTGGPFGCAIFEKRVGVVTTTAGENADAEYRLVSVGVNRVVPLGNSTLHGETVAIQMAQRAVGSYTLRGMETKATTTAAATAGNLNVVEDEKKIEEEEETELATTMTTTTPSTSYEMYSSCEPCAMCLGATLWSGVSRIVCGASKDDAASIGFDEGPVFEESYDHLRSAGVAVERCVLREEAAAVLRSYGESGVIYNR